MNLHSLHLLTVPALAELNIPYYPLLRREVDCIIALDASADSQVRSSYHATDSNLRSFPLGPMVHTS